MKSCISFEGAGVIKLTTIITAKPTGSPNSADYMLLRMNQQTFD